jgi:hypothetical protein
MRNLSLNELCRVAGGEIIPAYETPDCEPTSKSKNNNGYGNGAESGPAPGHSGDRDSAQGFNANFGPRGER